MEDFPALPTTSNQQQARRPPTTTKQPTDTMGDIFALNQEFAELNSLVNIAELTRAVRELNSQLRLCTNSAQYLMTFNSFMTNLDKFFNIKNWTKSY